MLSLVTPGSLAAAASAPWSPVVASAPTSATKTSDDRARFLTIRTMSPLAVRLSVGPTLLREPRAGAAALVEQCSGDAPEVPGEAPTCPRGSPGGSPA